MTAVSALDPSSAPAALPYNRRVALRYVCAATTGTELAVDDRNLFRRVRVENISQGGIALWLKEPPAEDALVYIRLNNVLLSFTYDLSARARHAMKIKGRWLVGFAFTRELTMAELSSLV